MDRPYLIDGTPFGQHATSPGSGTRGLFQDGNPTLGILPTVVPGYALNELIEEIRNAIIGAGLTPDDANWFQLRDAIKALAAGRFIGAQGFGAPGTFTYTPSAGVRFCIVEAVGAGGAGGGAPATGSGQYSAGGGGGGGGFFRKLIQNPAASTIVIGAGGAQVSAGAGFAGGSTSFAGTYVASGGSGGNAFGPTNLPFVVNPGGGGSGNTGDITTGGNPGVPGFCSANNVVGGVGGSNTLFAGAGFGAAGQQGGDAQGSGCGGGGSSRGPSLGALPGGAGAAGFMLISEYG